MTPDSRLRAAHTRQLAELATEPADLAATSETTTTPIPSNVKGRLDIPAGHRQESSPA